MRIFGIVALGVALSLSGEAIAQKGDATLKAVFDLQFDCERPFSVRNHPIRAVFTGVLHADRNASADLAISGVLLTNRVHFDARLGNASQEAPGGTSSLRVVSRHQIRAIWDLPNNQLVLNIVGKGRSCSANLSLRLKPGMREYSVFDGNLMSYCSRYRLLQTTCEAN
ncbi:MAG TPA: hypothetical protein VKS24_12435 [Bradyrhizobium sp.]|nr:hypothetical protein [Bradyrhizobium sp.]